MCLIYRVDIISCIDLSSSMNSIVDLFKLTFYNSIQNIKYHFQNKTKSIEVFRVKIIGFKNVNEIGDFLLDESSWFILPGNEDKLELFFEKLKADGEDISSAPGLQAIEQAIKQNWTSRADRQRHIIILFSNKGTNNTVDFNDLTDWWDGQEYMTNSSAKRLILFAPDSNAWTDIATHWENTIHHPSKAGNGLDYNNILESLVSNSI